MEREIPKLHEMEYKFAEIVWETEPVHSRKLAELCLDRLNWQRTTMYTVLHKLCDRGVLQNDHAIVTSLVSREEVRRAESRNVLQRAFDSSLPAFVAAYMSGGQLTEQERQELLKLLEKA